MPVAGDVCCPGCRRRRVGCEVEVSPHCCCRSRCRMFDCVSPAARPSVRAVERAARPAAAAAGSLIMISRFSCLHFLQCARLGRGTDRRERCHGSFGFRYRYTGDGFCFESAEFPQGNVMAALGWVERRGVAHLVRSVCQTGAVVVLRSRRLWSTRRKPSASSRASSMSSLCDVRPAAWRRAVVFHDERPSGSECRLGVGFALVVGSLIDAALIEACPSLPCRVFRRPP